MRQRREGHQCRVRYQASYRCGQLELTPIEEHLGVSLKHKSLSYPPTPTPTPRRARELGIPAFISTSHWLTVASAGMAQKLLPWLFLPAVGGKRVSYSNRKS